MVNRKPYLPRKQERSGLGNALTIAAFIVGVGLWAVSMGIAFAGGL